MFERKGVSDVIANVLIILLVLVAISLVWFFIRGTIERGASGTVGAVDCLSIDIEPTSCANQTSTPTAEDYNVTVRRNIGSGDLQGIKLVFKTGSGNNVKNVTFEGLAELEEKQYKIVVGSYPSEVSIAPVVGTGTSAKTCSIRPKTVACTPGE